MKRSPFSVKISHVKLLEMFLVANPTFKGRVISLLIPMINGLEFGSSFRGLGFCVSIRSLS